MSVTTHYIIFFCIIIVAFITGCINYRKEDKKVKPIIILLGFTFASQLGHFFAGKYLRNNVPVDHLIVPVLLTLWGIFYYNTIEEARLRKVIKWLTVVLVLFSVVNTIFIQDINTLPDNIMKMAVLYNLLFGGTLLIQMLDSPSKENIFTNSYFLIALAVVWFNSISSFYFFLTSFMSKYEIRSMFVNYLHFYSNYIYYLIILTAMFFLKKSNKDAGKIR